jgi:hypothetical protein
MITSKLKVEITGNSFRNLSIFLLVYLIGSPLLGPYPSMSVISHLSLTIILFLAAYTVQKQQGQRPYILAIIVPLLLLYWLGTYDIVSFTLSGAYLLLVLYFGLLICSYIVQIFRSPRVNSNVLYAAFCLYLMIGLLWGTAYALLDHWIPGAYSGFLLVETQENLIHIYNYFSMVTLTSLGYGDITPRTAGAASLCQLEAIVGQFFTTVLVAWLVGNYVSDKREIDKATLTEKES